MLRGCPVTVAQNTTVSDTYRGIGDSIGRYSGILILGIGGIDRKTARRRAQKDYLSTPPRCGQKSWHCENTRDARTHLSHPNLYAHA